MILRFSFAVHFILLVSASSVEAQRLSIAEAQQILNSGLNTEKPELVNVEAFCRNHTLLGGINSQWGFAFDRILVEPPNNGFNGYEKRWLESTKSQSNADKFLLEYVEKRQSPWGYTPFPSEKLKEAGWIAPTGVFSIFNYDISELRGCLQSQCLGKFPRGQMRLDDLWQRPLEQLEDVKVGLAGATVVCGFVTLWSGLGCGEGVSKIVKWGRPVSEHGHSMMLIPIWKEVFESPYYEEPLAHAALKVLERYEKGGVPAGDFFTDIKSSFLESGVRESEAESMTWNVVGLIATGGANTGIRARDLDVFGKDRLKASLDVLAYIPTILDSRSQSQIKPYSYPNGIRTKCDFGKPYHFWMTAYFARRLALETKDITVAASAAFTVQKGYEMKKTGNGRDANRIFRVNTFDSFNNIMRMDLAFAGAGAWYGALAAKGHHRGKAFQIDEALKKIVSGVQTKEPLASNKASALWSNPVKALLRWNQIMNPDASYKYFKSQFSSQY